MPQTIGHLPHLLDGAGFNQLVRGRYGYLLFNTRDVYVGRAMGVYGEYGEIECQVFHAFCRPGDVVIEVGANVGSQTLALARCVGETGHVYAIEPQRVVFQTLCANMALNSISHVTCVNAAAGTSSGFLRMPELDYAREGNYGGVSAGTAMGYRVPLIRLDDYLEIDRLRLLKIDVEGMEIDVLEGAKGLIARFRPALYVENDRADASEALIHKLRELGYRSYWHLPPLFNGRNFAGESANLFPNVVSCNMLCFPVEADAQIAGLREADDPTWHPLRQ